MFYDKIIKVTVRPVHDKKVYRVYHRLLCHYSGYFGRMLNGPFSEGSSTCLRLKEDDAETFQFFYYWLNPGVVDCSNDNKSLKLLTSLPTFTRHTSFRVLF